MRPSSFVCWAETSRPCRYSSTRTPRAGRPRSVSSTCVEMDGRRSAMRLAPAGIHNLEDRQDAEVVHIGAVVAFHEQGGLRHHGTAGAPDQLAHSLQRLPRADDVIHQPHPFALHLHRVTAVNVEFLFHLRRDRLVPHYHRGEPERADLFSAYDVGFEPEVRGDGMRQRDALRLGGHEKVAVLHLRRQLPRRAVDDFGVAEAVVVGDPRIWGYLNERQAPHRAGDLEIVARLATERQNMGHLFPSPVIWERLRQFLSNGNESLSRLGLPGLPSLLGLSTHYTS